MKTLEQEILELTQQWMESKGIGKDADCHFYIERRWSYGDDPQWFVQHWGYIDGDWEFAKGTYGQCLQELKHQLKRMIEAHKDE